MSLFEMNQVKSLDRAVLGANVPHCGAWVAALRTIKQPVFSFQKETLMLLYEAIQEWLRRETE